MDRVSAARGRLLKVKADLSSPAVSHPCVQCRHYALVCTNPAVAEISVSPETGSIKSSGVDARKARSEEGICGPEGLLWEERSVPGAVMVGMLQSSAGRWVIGIGALIAGAVLFG